MANKGDTRFAAERRVWRLQMTEMRRNLQNEELVARREKYLADHEKKAAFEAEQARHQPSPMAQNCGSLRAGPPRLPERRGGWCKAGASWGGYAI